MNEKSYKNMIKSLATAGYRVTPQRKAVCRVLASSEEHPSAQMIYDILRAEDDTFNLATVYNTLDTLGKLGAINILGDIGDHEVRYDGNTDPHANLACIRCHKVIDVESQHVSGLADEINQASGYTVLGARVLYYGVCPDCQNLPVETNQEQ